MIGGGYNLDWKFSFTFLENYNMLIHDSFPKTTPLSVFWSLCIEEHFYIFWLIMLYFLPVKHVFKFLILGILFSWCARFIEPYIFHNSNITTNDLFTNLDLFATGGVLGYFVAVDKQKVIAVFLDFLTKYKYLILSVILSIVLFQNTLFPYIEGSLFNIFRPTIFAISFTFLLMMFVVNVFEIKSKVLNYLGTISYGLYVFHMIFIHITFQYCIKNEIKIDNWLYLTIFTTLVFVLSVITSSLSYHFFEMRFLRFREKNFNQ